MISFMGANRSVTKNRILSVLPWSAFALQLRAIWPVFRTRVLLTMLSGIESASALSCSRAQCPFVPLSVKPEIGLKRCQSE